MKIIGIMILLMSIIPLGCRNAENPEKNFPENPDSVKVTTKGENKKDNPASAKTSIYENFSEESDGNSVNQKIQTARKFRIAYFGDSIIEGDILTDDLRRMLQSEYGGSGVGYVPITSPSAPMRGSIKSEYSGNWSSFSVMNGRKKMLFGMDGTVSIPIITGENGEPEDKASYAVFRTGSSQSSFSGPVLYFYYPEGAGHINLNCGGETKNIKISGNPSVQALRLDVANASQMKIQFCPDDTMYVFGLMFGGSDGVHIDNLALRGHSGLCLNRISRQFIQEFSRQTSYDMIILQYGMNVLQDSSVDYSWYTSGMQPQIQYLKSIFPNARIMVVSTHDRAYKKNNSFVSFNSTPQLVGAQREIARKTHSEFFDLYDAMGGKDSMPKWVEQKMAASDYTHFNYYGGKKIAVMLKKFIN